MQQVKSFINNNKLALSCSVILVLVPIIFNLVNLYCYDNINWSETSAIGTIEAAATALFLGLKNPKSELKINIYPLDEIRRFEFCTLSGNSGWFKLKRVTLSPKYGQNKVIFDNKNDLLNDNKFQPLKYYILVNVNRPSYNVDIDRKIISQLKPAPPLPSEQKRSIHRKDEIIFTFLTNEGTKSFFYDSWY